MVGWVVLKKPVEIQSSFLPDWLSVWPPASGGLIDPVFVEDEVGGGIGALGRESEGIQGGCRTIGTNALGEGAVFVAGGY